MSVGTEGISARCKQPTAIWQKVRLPIGRNVKNGHKRGTKGEKERERETEKNLLVDEKVGRSVGGKKSSKEESSLDLSWECYDIRALSRKATQTVTLRRRIDKILERDVDYNAVETLTGTWNISMAGCIVNKRRNVDTFR